jgi:tubulin polyglutamylase TTLL5
MLKCESKLIKFLFELNGLVATDRHDWNLLWTHTQGKNYFYERLNPYQKVNHFPVTVELTRKDRMAINIKRMQDKHSYLYFNFIPPTFVLPEQWDLFTDSFEREEQILRN